MHQTRQGVTLIEIVIALVIVAVVAAILFPVFAQSKHHRYRTTSCLSNENQLGLGFTEYMQDCDNRMPSGGKALAGAGWAGRLYPYVKSVGVFQCPDDPADPISTRNGWLEPVSYAVNQNLYLGGVQGKGGSLRAPSSTVLLCEVQGPLALLTLPDEGVPKSRTISATVDGLDCVPADRIDHLDGTSVGEPLRYATGEMGGIAPLNLAANFTGPQGIHNGGSNFLLCDGHAKYLHGAVVSPGRTAAPGQYQNQSPGYAAATSSMQDVAGHQFKATFSPI